MSEVRIRWTQRAAGRNVGDVETLELTPWIEAIIAAGRVVVLPSEDASPVQTPPVEVSEEASRPRRAKPAAPEEVGDGQAGPE